jgi:hypothetical protein
LLRITWTAIVPIADDPLAPMALLADMRRALLVECGANVEGGALIELRESGSNYASIAYTVNHPIITGA